MVTFLSFFVFFFFNDTATTEIYTLSLHDALPISRAHQHRRDPPVNPHDGRSGDRKSTRLNSSHVEISYAVFCLKKKKQEQYRREVNATTCACNTGKESNACA